MDLISQLRVHCVRPLAASQLCDYIISLFSLHWKAKPTSQEVIYSYAAWPAVSINEEFLLVLILLCYYSCFRDQKRILYPQGSTADQWASKPTLNCKERGSMQRNGGPEQPQMMTHALRMPWGVHWQVQINKDGLILLTLLLPTCGWTDRGKCYACKPFCKGLQPSQSVPSLLHLRAYWLLGCLSVSERGQ